jgi:shikimate dehydrogenase
MKFGLIGYQIGHSKSPAYFNKKFSDLGLQDFSYALYEIHRPEDLPDLLKQTDVTGFNVTIPYKTAIMQFLDEIDGDAEEIGAVNTLVRIGPGSWKGYNTDTSGFQIALMDWYQADEVELPEQALVLGTGGAAKAVAFALRQLNISRAFVSRQEGFDFTWDTLTPEIIQSYSLIINTTPLGMFPAVDGFPPVPYEALTSKHRLFDLIANPLNTLFLTRGKQMGAKTLHGLEMLHLQADHAWEIWKKYGRF